MILKIKPCCIVGKGFSIQVQNIQDIYGYKSTEFRVSTYLDRIKINYCPNCGQKIEIEIE